MAQQFSRAGAVSRGRRIAPALLGLIASALPAGCAGEIAQSDGGGADDSGRAQLDGGSDTDAGSTDIDAGAPAIDGGSDGDPCDSPPPASPLVGWASVAGRGLATTTGGGNATPQVVTTLAELRSAVGGTTASVIYVRGVLEPGDIAIGSNKTIVGLCGAEIHGAIQLSGSSNVIVRNITIVGYGAGDCALDPDYDPGVGCSSGSDAVGIVNASHHIWFDHCEVRDGTDGNLDVTNGSDFVTVSWTRFRYTPRTDDEGGDSTGADGHRFSNLIGGTDDPDARGDGNALNVTWHHNHWDEGVVERMPRVRFGRNHLFDNLFDSSVANYCVRAGRGARILLENNTFDGVRDPHEFNNATDEATASIVARDNSYIGGTSGERATGGGGTPWTDPEYEYSLEPAADARAAILAGGGPQ